MTYIIDRIFDESDIDPSDTSTRTPENSPTMAEFLAVVTELADHPEGFWDSPTVLDRVQDFAADLRVALQAITEGSTHENMAEESKLDTLTTDDKVVYLDLLQVGERPDGLGKQSYIMQLLLTKIYQQAKVIDERVEVIIDEAYYLFNDEANLAFLTQIARHQRHAGLRLVLLSQTLDDFYDTDAEVVEKIAGMCPIQVHHREPQLDAETAADAELTTEQQEFIREHAEAGKESQGYSNALVRVDEHGDYPLQIETSPEEKAIIEYDDRGGLLADLTDDHDGLAEFRALLRERYLQTTLDQHGFAADTVDRLIEEGLTDRGLLAIIKLAVEQFGEEWSLEPDAMEQTKSAMLDQVFEEMNGTAVAKNETGEWSVFKDGEHVEPPQSDDD